MRRSTETDLLLLCARPHLDERAVNRLQALLRQDIDWSSVFELADSYRTTPLLALHLRRHADEQLRSDVREALQAHHMESTRHNLALAVEVLRLFELLTANGIGVIPFKGPISAMLAYGDMGMRACGDIDLLVRQADHAATERILEHEGYRVVQRYEEAMQSGLWHEQRLMNVDLHWGIPPQRLHLKYQRFREAMQPVNLLGRPVPTFSRRDTVLVMAINVVKEYWGPSLHQLSDIVALTADYSPADWKATFRRARETGCLRMLAAALLLAHRLLEMPLPAAAPAGLMQHKGIARVADELADHLFPSSGDAVAEDPMQLFHHGHAHTYYLTLTDSAWQRTADWLEWAGSPSRADRDFIRLPRRIAFLYFLIRPLRLLLKRL